MHNHNLTLKEKCVRRLTGLKESRQGFEADAREIAAFAQPARSRWMAGSTNKGKAGRQYNRNMNSSHGTFAFRTLQGGMTSGLSSQSRPWMSLGSFDERFNDDQEVRAYFADVERRVYG
ncbi:MAG: portal protein, partial [Gemmatimonadota bacterium]|nr:portal protein [Gemmatimonadota bacterium]